MLHIAFDNSYARDLEGLYVPVEGAPAPAPEMVLLNEGLARELGLDPAALQTPAGLAMLSGSAMPDGAAPLAMAYAGHQFGGFSPQLGDGRALLVGEGLAELREYEARVRRVDADVIRAAAERWIRPEMMVEAVVRGSGGGR